MPFILSEQRQEDADNAFRWYRVEPKDYSAKAIDLALRKKRDELLKRSQ